METRTRTKVAVLWCGAAAVLLPAASLVACGGGDGGSPAAPKTIEMTPAAQTGASVDAAVGDTIVVSLDANPTTGFSWAFVAGDTFDIAGSKYVPDQSSEGALGAGGTQIVTLKVTKAGTSDLTGTYRQQWNAPSPDARPDLSLTIVSTD